MRDLREENPHASEADLREAVKGAVQSMIAKSTEQRQRVGTQRVAAESDMPREVLCLPEARRAPARTSPDPLPAECSGERDPRWNRCTTTSVASGATCTRRSGTATRISSEATPGIARAHETTNREADARGWDPAAVDVMLQEVEESTATLLPAAEQVLQELEEEARANWEERAVYHAMQVTNFGRRGIRDPE